MAINWSPLFGLKLSPMGFLHDHDLLRIIIEGKERLCFSLLAFLVTFKNQKCWCITLGRLSSLTLFDHSTSTSAANSLLKRKAKWLLTFGKSKSLFCSYMLWGCKCAWTGILVYTWLIFWVTISNAACIWKNDIPWGNQYEGWCRGRILLMCLAGEPCDILPSHCVLISFWTGYSPQKWQNSHTQEKELIFHTLDPSGQILLLNFSQKFHYSQRRTRLYLLI